MFHQIGKNKSISEQVEDELTEAIRSGKYSPGHRIPTENELCEIFSVSRTTIREAVKRMSARGLVEVKRGSGVFVSEMSIKNTSEILNMFFELSTDEDVVLQTINARLIIEPIIAAEAAKLRTKEHIALLERNMDNMRLCDINDKKLEAELDNDFHRMLLSIVNNNVLALLLSPIYNLMPKFKASVFAKPTEGNLKADKIIMLNHHDKVMQAIINQDVQGVTVAMKNHILETKSNYLILHK